MTRAYLGLGTNLGDKDANLHQAIRLIEEQVGHVVAVSAFHATEPWGFDSPHTFLNAACVVDTALAPTQLLEATQAIERWMGRLEKSHDGHYADRLIDIDILLYGHERVNLPGLVIPHPLIQEREFVRVPLEEVMTAENQLKNKKE
jgi:2-amino-4-hydroxy-6-hydroxymethyldihydropteridine diphosphokinase